MLFWFGKQTTPPLCSLVPKRMKIEVSILREIGAKRILRCTTTIGEKQSFSIGVGEAVTVSEFLRVMVDHLTKKCIIVSEKEFIVVVLVGDHPKRLEDEEKITGEDEGWESRDVGRLPSPFG